MKTLAHLVMILLLVAPLVLRAQLFDDATSVNTDAFNISPGLPGDVQEDIALDITPANPRPGETVTVKLSSNATDLHKAQITWRLNNTIMLEQVGATELSFTLGQLNESQSLNVSVSKYGGGEITTTRFFTPTEVDLLYEANTYVPPFYEGRPWSTHQSTVRVIALPRILDDYDRLIPAEEYVYTWRENGKVIQDQSGFGKNIFTFTNGLLEENVRVSVDAVPRNYGAVAQGSITITPVDPVVVVYEKNPIHGTIFEQAISGIFALTRDEVTFRTIPFFFSGGTLSHTWSMNGQVLDNAIKPDEVTFRIEGETEGLSNIATSITSSDKILQSAASSFQLIFEKN